RVVSHAANWYPDPFGRHQLRYYDGLEWTPHVSTNGQASVDAPMQAAPGSAVPRPDHSPQQVQAQVQQRAGIQGGAFAGGGSLFTEPILVVNQKAKFIELENEYAIHDQSGRQIGAVRQVGQSTGKKVLRALTSLDQY